MLSYIITFFLGFAFCKFLPDLRQRYFAKFMDYMTSNANPKYVAFKKEAFKSIKNVKPLTGKNLKILEIGVGTGANFQYYPDNCHLIVVDPNPHFRSYYDKNRAQFPQIKSEEIIVAKGEEMDMVEDNSVDVVVMSLVFCSISEAGAVLKNVHRVLIPGGKFYFLDHIQEWDKEAHGTRLTIQNLLTFTGIWPFLFDGCYLNRNMHLDVNKAGFSDVKCTKAYAPFTEGFFQLIAPHCYGVATK